MTVTLETVCMAKSQLTKNQTECRDFPQDYLAIIIITGIRPTLSER